MTTAISNSTSTNGAPLAALQSSSALSPAAGSLSSSSTSSSSTSATGSLHNPRVTLDPAAGFITQYLSANDSEVISQTPNAITVAYLRLGLTADGLTKKSGQTEHVATTA